jgi:hypothetical protein
MKQKSGPDKAPAEQVVKDIRRQTRRQPQDEKALVLADQFVEHGRIKRQTAVRPPQLAGMGFSLRERSLLASRHFAAVQ